MNLFAKRFLLDDTGATAIEYSLVAAMIAVVIVTAVTTVGTNLNVRYNSVATAFK